MNKRKRFIITSVLSTFGFLGIQFLDDKYRFFGIGALSFITLLLFVWSLREGLKFSWTLLSLILPIMFTLGVGIFWFLLPASPITRVPIFLLFAIGIYALCLTSNIYTVSAIRNIALLRAARGVGFVLSLLTSFLLFDAILSLKTLILFQPLLVLLVSIPMFLQGFWVVRLNESVDSEIILLTIVSSIVMSQVSIALYFWPVTVVVGSLFLTGLEYIILGLGQSRLEGRLFLQTVREYLLVGFMVFLGMFLVTRWAG